MEPSLSMTEWGWVQVKHLSTSKVKAAGRRGSYHLSVNNRKATSEATWGSRVYRDTHAAFTSSLNAHNQCHAENPIIPVMESYHIGFLSLSYKLNMRIRGESQHREREMIKKLLTMYHWKSETPTLCSCVATKVWKPGATPKPSSWTNGGSAWLWICTRTPASKAVSSGERQIETHC